MSGINDRMTAFIIATFNRMGIDKKTKEKMIADFFSNTGATYDKVVCCFTLGIDRLWKKKMIEKLIASNRSHPPADVVTSADVVTPKKILELACGTGILTLLIATRFPESEVVAVDISPGYLEVAWRNAYKKKIKNVSFILSPAEELKSTDRFNVVTASYLAKYADLDLLIHNLSTMIDPGGVLLFHDFTYPKSRFLQFLFEWYFKWVPVIGGWWYPEWKAVFRELPHLIRKTEWVSELTTALTREGFYDIEVESLTLEGSALVSARKK